MAVSRIDDVQALRELEEVRIGLPPGLTVSWLGVSGYRLTFNGVSLFIDPYVSRVPLRSLLLRRTAMPDEALIDRYASAPGDVAGVLVGHRTSTMQSTRPRSRGAIARRPTARHRSATSCGSTASAISL